MAKQIKFNDFKKEAQILRPKLQKAFSKFLDSGWYILGQEVEEFEKEFAEFNGNKYCIGVGNGLEALQISLMALGIGKGDEVITTPISAVATTIAILAVGATPVFVDTDNRGLLNADLVEEAINKKTKAILPVHLYGQAVDLEKILKLCRKYKIHLLEDACQAHGATYQGKKLGSFGVLNSFSFYPTKNLGALGDGGAIVTDDEKLAEKCRTIRDYGQSGKYVHTELGLNSRLDEIQAAFLRVKLKNLEKENQKRKALAKLYVKNLSKNRNVQIVTTDLENSNFHQFVILVEKRDELQKVLKEKGIPTLIHYPGTIPDQPFLEDKHLKLKIPVARDFVSKTLSLPCNPLTTTAEVNYICKIINSY